jgi:hypothetical protein
MCLLTNIMSCLSTIGQTVKSKNLMYTQLKKFSTLIYIILIVLCLAPRIYLSYNQGVNDFIYAGVTNAQVAVNSGQVLTNSLSAPAGTLQLQANYISERTALTSFLAILSQVLGCSVLNLTFVPIDSIIILILSYALAYILTKSKFAAFAFTLFIAYEPSTGNMDNTVFYIGFGFTLLFLYLIIFSKMWLEKSQNLKNNAFLICVFVTLVLTYYTSEFDVIIFTSAICVLSLFFFKRDNKRTMLFFLTCILLLIFVGFDSNFYSYSNIVTENSSLQFLSNYYSFVLKLVGGNTAVTQAYVSEVSTARVGLGLFISIFIPVLIYSVLVSIRLLKKKSQNIAHDIIYLALLVPLFGEVIIYTSLGIFAFNYIFLIYSLLAFIALNKLRTIQGNKIIFRRLRFLAVILICLIVCLSFIKFSSWVQDPKLGYAHSYASSMDSTVSFTSLFTLPGNIITDIKIGEQLLGDLSVTQQINNLTIYTYTNDNSRFLYENNSTTANTIFQQNNYDYLILSYRSISHTTSGDGWLSRAPLGPAFNFYQSYNNFERVYDDGKGILYRFNS